jgi:hypothetical protein
MIGMVGQSVIKVNCHRISLVTGKSPSSPLPFDRRTWPISYWVEMSLCGIATLIAITFALKLSYIAIFR